MKRANNILIGIIIFLTIIIIGLITLLVLTLLNIKEKPFKKEEPVDITVNEKVLSFLNSTTSLSGEVYYNILDNNKTDEEIFNLVILYLYENNLYKLENGEYIFKQSDINNIVKKYMLKNEFNYITLNPNYRYNQVDKTFITKIQPNGRKAILLKSLDIYEKTETMAYVLYELEGYYIDNSVMISNTYNIAVNITGDYKVENITKTK